MKIYYYLANGRYSFRSSLEMVKKSVAKLTEADLKGKR